MNQSKPIIRALWNRRDLNASQAALELALSKWQTLEISSGLIVGLLAAGLSGCAHGGSKFDMPLNQEGLKQVSVTSPVLLRMKSKPGSVEKIKYLHKSLSKSYEDADLRNQKDQSIEFTSQAETVKVAADSFTQTLSLIAKEGEADMHDFAMPELGEKLDVTADFRGRILHAGNYPANSIFYVPPVSLPDGPVSVGDTWSMQSSWLTLDEMVPFQLDMVRILKGVFECGTDQCAEIEIQGNVTLQGSLVQSMTFKSSWRGRMYFAIQAGTVVWSRIDSAEVMNTDRARRDVTACLEAAMLEPKGIRIANHENPTCNAESEIKVPDTVVLPGVSSVLSGAASSKH